MPPPPYHITAALYPSLRPLSVTHIALDLEHYTLNVSQYKLLLELNTQHLAHHILKTTQQPTALVTLHTALGTLHTSLGTPHTALGILRNALLTVNTTHGTIYTALGKLHTALGTLHTALGTLHTELAKTQQWKSVAASPSFTPQAPMCLA